MDDTGPVTLFVSTSMHAKLEEIESMESKKQHHKQVLGVFKHKSTPPTLNTYSKQKRSLKGTRRRIKSINSLVSENFSNGKGSTRKKDAGTPNMEHSILRFFSGKKHKIADIIKRIDDVEHPKNGTEILETQSSSSSSSSYTKSGPRVTYTEAEWKTILQSIKLKFPSLSRGTKQSLKQLTKQIRESQSEPTMWSQSSFMPSNAELNSDDIRWLYDLEDGKEEQDLSDFVHTVKRQESGGGPFSLTLSQALLTSHYNHDTNDNHGTEPEKLPVLSDATIDETETISDSEPDDSTLMVDPPRLQIQETVDFGPISSHQPESYSLIPVDSLLERDPQISTHSSVIPVVDSVPGNEEIFSSIIKEGDAFSVQEIKSPKRSPGKNQSRKISREALLENVVEDDYECNHQHEEIVSSPIQSLMKVPRTPSTGHATPRRQQSLARLTESSQHSQGSASEQFQTAEQYTMVNSEVLELPKGRLVRSYTPKKRFRTSLYEIRGAVEVQALNVEHVQVRKISTKREVPIDSEEEIGDSEDDYDTSISVMEISREIPPEEVRSPVVQVPSSPRA